MSATEQIMGSQGICQLLELLRMSASEERIGAMLKIDALAAYAVSQPMVLIEADTRRKRQIGTDAHKHPTPVSVVNVKVVLHDPTLRQLEVPAVLFSDGNHDPGWFPGFENNHHCIVLGVLKVGIKRTSVFWRRRRTCRLARFRQTRWRSCSMISASNAPPPSA